MNIVFVSNYFNHHQRELSEQLFQKSCGNYTFIETQPMEENRIKLGWKTTLPSYVRCSYESEREYAECLSLINNADAVIVGSAPNAMIHTRIKAKKLTFRYSERIFKKKDFDPLRRLKYTYRSLFDKRGNVYYLLSSAYALKDYKRCGVSAKRCYKWGYFPPIKRYEDIDVLIAAKQPTTILWTARLISWKHPEAAVEIARRLKADGYAFEMNLIGTGVMEETIRITLENENLTDCVHLLGSMPPEIVRAHMENSAIFLFTSDRNEGWGAVLNESMNSACAVVASHAIGSVPFLMENGKSGLIYRDGDLDDLYNKVKRLLDNAEERKQMAKSAYETVLAQWNAEVAAERFMELAEAKLSQKTLSTHAEGPCAEA